MHFHGKALKMLAQNELCIITRAHSFPWAAEFAISSGILIFMWKFAENGKMILQNRVAIDSRHNQHEFAIAVGAN